MRVTIINCPVRVNAPCNNVPLGVYTIGGMIEERLKDVEVSYLDLNLARPEISRVNAEASIEVENSDIFMLSGLITTLAWQRDLCSMIRAKHPNAKIISGGGLASNIGEELLNWIDCDAVVRGEGDMIAAKLVAHVAEGELQALYDERGPVPSTRWGRINWDSVVGLESYIRNPIWGGAAKNSSSTPFTMERSLNMVVSRGCPFSCKFCSKEALGGRSYRRMEAADIALEAARLAREHSLDFIGFPDDNLLVGDTKELADALGGWTVRGWQWGCHARFDECDDPVALAALRDSGCAYIGFGGESANREVLAAMDKKNDPDQMIRVLKYCRHHGIHPNATWMMGWPEETRSQIRETAQFILKHAPENKSIFTATAYPGTRLWDEVEDQVLEKFGTVEKYVEQLGDATEPIINLSAMTDEEFFGVRGYIERGELEKI